jgi:hypothetical protein
MDASMVHLPNAQAAWWLTPLVLHRGKPTVAELAILDLACGLGEAGVWMNSRGTETGVRDLVRNSAKPSGYEAIRVPLPPRVATTLRALYRKSRLDHGAPALLIWNDSGALVRFIEVKFGHGSDLNGVQRRFLECATAAKIACTRVEWAFEGT